LQQDTFAGQQGNGSSVDELGAVISLKALGQGAELGLGVSEEINNMRMNIKFMAQRKNLDKVTVIINYDQIIFEARSAQHRKHPYIAMKKLKRSRSTRSGTSKRQMRVFAKLTTWCFITIYCRQFTKSGDSYRIGMTKTVMSQG